MSDDEFQEAVMARFDRIGDRLSVIVSRLGEQDVAHDRLQDKVDRMAHAVRDALDASEQSLSAITSLSRRVQRLEHPSGDAAE
ncbi:MAG: hypothetical protein AAFP13_15780 [Pseudomonadota bacterium]